jgi:hypothetical protein
MGNERIEMKRLLTPAEAEARLRAIANKDNAQAGKESKPANDDLGFLGRSRPRNQETKNSFSVTNQELKESICAETAILFEKFGDIMGIVDHHPAFQKAVRQWNVFPQALTEACKLHGVPKVLDTIRYTANYPAAKSKAGFFWSVLKNGKRGLR